MFAKTVEDLDVFQRAYALSLAVHKESLNFPKIEQYALADQLRRSSKSVCANLAEGYSRQRASSADFRRFIMLAIGSSDETSIWLRYTFDLGYITEAQKDRWREEYSIVSRMMQSLYTRISDN